MTTKTKIVTSLEKENGFWIAKIYHHTPTMFMGGYDYTMRYLYYSKKEVINKLRQEEKALVTNHLIKYGCEYDLEKLTR